MEQTQQNAANQTAAQVQAMLAQTRDSALAKAFVAAWGEIPAVVEKDANNPHFGNDYATLEACERLIKPILAKHKLAFPQSPGRIVGVSGDRIEVVGVLVHESGERWSFAMEMPLGAKLTAQAAGSATTYARRYQMLAVFGIAPTDDDGEAASAPVPAAPKRAAKKDSSKKADKAEKDEPSYADRKQALVDAINAFEGTSDELSDQLKPQVEELQDSDVNEAYVAKRRALRGKK